MLGCLIQRLPQKISEKSQKEVTVMGRGDARRSAKMRRLKSLKKFKARQKRKIEAIKKARKKK